MSTFDITDASALLHSGVAIKNKPSAGSCFLKRTCILVLDRNLFSILGCSTRIWRVSFVDLVATHFSPGRRC